MAGDTLRIGICDDDKDDLLWIEEAVRTSIIKLNIPVTIESHLFGIGKDMYESNRQEGFDLFFDTEGKIPVEDMGKKRI